MELYFQGRIIASVDHNDTEPQLATSNSSIKPRFESEVQHALFQHLAVGLCVVSSDGCVVTSNAAAETLYQGTPISSVVAGKPLFATESQCESGLYQAVLGAAQMSGEEQHVEHFVFRSASSPFEPTLVEVQPLPVQDPQRLDGGSALVTILKPDRDQSFSVSWVAKLFDLSKAELLTFRLLIDGLTMGEIAQSRGVGLETIRSQVKSIRQKTGCRRRAEMMHLVLKNQPVRFNWKSTDHLPQ